MDAEKITLLIIEELKHQPGRWVTFKEIARRALGNPELEAYVAGICTQRKDLFIVGQNTRTKLAEANQYVPTTSIGMPPSLVASSAVREYARQLPVASVRVRAVHPGKQVLNRFLHALEVEVDDDDLRLPDDTPVELHFSNRSPNAGLISGISRDEGIVYVSFRYQVELSDIPNRLIIHRVRPLLDLADRLEKLQEMPKLARMLQQGQPGTSWDRDDSGLLARDLTDLAAPWARLLWGPPGAGKTHCIGRFSVLRALQGDDERILIVGPSNVAADAAVLEIVKALRGTGKGPELLATRRVMRFGYPRDERVLEIMELFGGSENERISKQILDHCGQLKRLRESNAPDAVIAEHNATLQQLEEKRKKAVAADVGQARILVTTVTSALLAASPVASTGWDTVIADEASMITPATILCLSSLASSRLLLAGDPRQLGPIFEWRGGAIPPTVASWMNQDPYEQAGLSKGKADQRVVQDNDLRLVRVLSQRRCHEKIWALVSDLYPKVGSGTDTAQLEAIAALPPIPGSPFVLLDLSSGRPAPREIPGSELEDAVASQYESACRKVGSTWENPPTAALAIDVAREIVASRPSVKVAILTPYRGQVRLLRRALDGERKVDPHLGNIEVGTVHAFQGGEADVVIFDVVDGPPRPQPGFLLRDDVGFRLLNVAFTRARGKLILIAHRDWIERTRHSGSSLLTKAVLGRTLASCPVLPPKVASAPDPTEEGQPESPIEEILVEEIDRRGAALPRRTLQHRIQNDEGRIVSRADIAFVEQRLAIYCDGARYHLERNQWQRDLRQRRELARLNWQVLVFSGKEINESSARCVDEVAAMLEATKS